LVWADGASIWRPAHALVLLLLFFVVCGCARVPPVALPDGASPGVELTATPFFPQESHQCGPAALATVLVASGVVVTPEQLVPQTYLPGRRGSLQVELMAAARTYATIPYVIDGTLAALLAELDAQHPVLVLLDLGVGPIAVWHYAVVIGYSRDTQEMVLRSGGNERLSMSVPLFMRSWQKSEQWALVALPPGQLPATAEPGRYVESIVPLEALGDLAAAQTAYATALRRWPDNQLALFGAANTSHRLGQLQAARRDYERLLVLTPDNPFVLNNLAEVLLDQGCPARAEELMDAACATGEVAAAHGDIAAAHGDIAAAHGDIAAALADTRAKAAMRRAQQLDRPACR
jgi:hypothetical protein